MSAPRSFLTNPRFLTASLLGSLVTGVTSIVATLPTQIAVLGVLVSILVGLVMAWLDEQARRDAERGGVRTVGKGVDALEDETEIRGGVPANRGRVRVAVRANRSCASFRGRHETLVSGRRVGAHGPRHHRIPGNRVVADGLPGTAEQRCLALVSLCRLGQMRQLLAGSAWPPQY